MTEGSWLPDQYHMELLRRRLWTGRSTGRVAVMIGAGFSRNAEPTSTNVQPLPLWTDLAGEMFDALYPPGSMTEEERQKERRTRAAGSGALALAQEYEATFGRLELEDLLRRMIRDSDYRPGLLHRMLLSLPWSDVFTTNYDTLLERAAKGEIDKRYDVVHSARDLPVSMRPRIVKLHGTLPDRRPFVLTEEDYRRYPRDCAPLVNLVQQALMENLLCLIGFSGDDPNFLAWTGWVRDNLGDAAPPIYLVCVGSLSGSFRQLLRTRNIIPIDLSQWAGSGEDVGQRQALQRFFEYLREGRLADPLEWPSRAATPLGKVIVRSCSDPKRVAGGKGTPPDRLLKEDDAWQLISEWRTIREAYPGWLVAPAAQRDRLWCETENWIHTVLRSAPGLEPVTGLCLLYELFWRLDTALMPLLRDWYPTVDQVVRALNPFPERVQLPGATWPQLPSDTDVDCRYLQRCWVELAFCLAQAARSAQEHDRFAEWMRLLEPVVRDNPEWMARWHFERCMNELYRLNLAGVRQELQTWRVEGESPAWVVRRAALLAELGDLEAAERLAETALAEVRSRLRPGEVDHALLSLEGWAMVLVKALKGSRWERTPTTEYRQRWAYLEAYGCNPWVEIEKLQLSLKGSPPPPPRQRERRPAFDPGVERITITMRSFGYILDSYRPAFAFLRLYERAGLPFYCGLVNLWQRTAIAAATWISSWEPEWSLSVILRAGRKEDFDWFDRARVAALTASEVDHLFRLLVEVARQACREVGLAGGQRSMYNTLASRIAPLSCELLSRLSIRVTPEQLGELLQLACDVYTLPGVRSAHELPEALGDLFKRVLYAMPTDGVLTHIDRLLALPIAGEAGFDVAVPQSWPEPLSRLDVEQRKIEADLGRRPWAYRIQRLISLVCEEKPEVRRRAISRLWTLNELGLLSQEELEQFARALWSRRDPSTGLPTDTGLSHACLLSLPEPTQGEATTLIRAWLASHEFPKVVEVDQGSDGWSRKRLAVGEPRDSFFAELLAATRTPGSTRPGIDWSTEEATAFLEKAVEWWQAQKDDFVEPFAEHLRGYVASFTELMAVVVLPRLAPADEATWRRALSILDEVEARGFLTLTTLPLRLIFNPDFAPTVAAELGRALRSPDEETVRSAAVGILRWLEYAGAQRIPPLPSTLIDDLVHNAAIVRRGPGLNHVLGCLTQLVRDAAPLLSEQHLQLLLVLLEHLLEATRVRAGEGETGDDEEEEHFSEIPMELRPIFRRAAASLARELYYYLCKERGEAPPILLEWNRAAHDDPLPEVRRVWCAG